MHTCVVVDRPAVVGVLRPAPWAAEGERADHVLAADAAQFIRHSVRVLRFEAAKAALIDNGDLGFSALVLAEHADGSGRSLEVQRSSEFTDKDRSLGMDDYCVVIDGGVVNYGGVHSWTVSLDGAVRFELNLPASRVLGVDGIEVVVDVGQVDLVRLGLGRLLG